MYLMKYITYKNYSKCSAIFLKEGRLSFYIGEINIYYLRLSLFSQIKAGSLIKSSFIAIQITVNKKQETPLKRW